MSGGKMSEMLSVTKHEHILHIQFNRPERKNAITFAMYGAMTQAIEAAVADNDSRVILLSGVGGNFTAGNDLEDFLTGARMGADSPVVIFMQALLNCPKPVVAAVDGVAVGIGVTMLLHCDLVYASENAQFKMPFVNLGLTPEFASSVIMPALMGYAKAAELFMLGEHFNSADALRYGLINQVVLDGELLSQAKSKCAQLARQPSDALMATKALLKEDLRAHYRQVIDRENAVFKDRLASPTFHKIATEFFRNKK